MDGDTMDLYYKITASVSRPGDRLRVKSPARAIRRMHRSGIREVFDLASTIPGVIHLEMGEPSFETPAHIRRAAASAAEEGYTKYTPNAGIPELREAVVRKVRERNGIDASVDQVVVTPGGVAALYGALLALCDPGDEVLISDPAWPNYRMIAALQHLRVRRFPLVPEHGMAPRAELVEPAIGERTKVLVLNSPGNPTGQVTDVAALRELIDLATAYGLWVVSDEVYDELVFEGEVAPSAGAYDPRGRVVTVFSFSKTYAMTGWRVGYAVAPPEVASLLIKAQEPITACVNGPAQRAALAALDGPQACVVAMRDAYRARRDEVVRRLDAVGVPHVEPRGAFYVWIDVSGSGLGGAEFAQRLLTELGVAVAPGSAFGAGGRDFVRISLAAAPGDLYEGVERLLRGIVEWGC